MKKILSIIFGSTRGKISKGGRPRKSHNLSETEKERMQFAVMKWIDEKKYREFSKKIDEVAVQMDVPKNLLYAYFAQVVSQDFRTWRTKLRIEDARKLLLTEKELSAKRVGEIVGFTDRSNFTRQFTKYVGCSPIEWRESHA